MWVRLTFVEETVATVVETLFAIFGRNKVAHGEEPGCEEGGQVNHSGTECAWVSALAGIAS